MSGQGVEPVGAPRDAAITIGPFKPSRPGYGPIHPLLQLRTWDPKPYAKYLAWNVIEHPMFAAIWVDFDGIKERGQPATSPIVEEINIGHVETGWSIRVRNRMGITCEDVLFAIYDFFASPLYVDELGEMHPRAVRIIVCPHDNSGEKQKTTSLIWVDVSFGKRRMGFFDLMEGYRKSDALLGQTYFDGIHNDQESVERLKKKYNFHSANLLLLRLGNC
ncbi:hypothetical protein V865_003327 [Kwoniella europaea PYCC6329]|uniref:DUF6699 domain-containing protein n=1 Tax=Kwoniella europaea PYCC6329 TaxID=1423913 RepID=A0AAX4KGQ9_9TREE